VARRPLNGELIRVGNHLRAIKKLELFVFLQSNMVGKSACIDMLTTLGLSSSNRRILGRLTEVPEKKPHIDGNKVNDDPNQDEPKS